VRRVRIGFTLLELMLVMVIIVVAASLSLPAMESMMADGRLKAARDMVRARWADIRGLAMREGRPYKFSIIEQTGKFRIEPEDSTAPSDTDDPATILEDELPPTILFNNQSSGGGSGSASSGGYECLVVYLADGTARDDVQIMFGKEGTRPIGLQLRALTGAVTLIDKPEDSQQ
jgi:prepilin-type N-terminal cleavage/methylation domain-containing protein